MNRSAVVDGAVRVPAKACGAPIAAGAIVACPARAGARVVDTRDSVSVPVATRHNVGALINAQGIEGKARSAVVAKRASESRLAAANAGRTPLQYGDAITVATDGHVRAPIVAIRTLVANGAAFTTWAAELARTGARAVSWWTRHRHSAAVAARNKR